MVNRGELLTTFVVGVVCSAPRYIELDALKFRQVGVVRRRSHEVHFGAECLVGGQDETTIPTTAATKDAARPDDGKGLARSAESKKGKEGT
jgi:hypothetical protein